MACPKHLPHYYEQQELRKAMEKRENNEDTATEQKSVTRRVHFQALYMFDERYSVSDPRPTVVAW